MEKRWFPLESNPGVMNCYIRNLGVDTSRFSFCDVLSTEDWALAMVPSPVLAVILLFPMKEETEEHRMKTQALIKENGQIVSSNLYFMRQTVSQACGTIGVLHALGNARETLSISQGSFMERFLAQTVGMNPDEIAAIVNDDQELESCHNEATLDGQTDRPSDNVTTHFVCFW